MEFLEKFLSEYGYLIEIFKTLIFLIISVVLFVKTRDVKYLSEACNMITRRTANYQETEKVSGQKFDNLKKVYRLNKVTGELEETDEVIDINELVNSYKDVVIDEILQRFLPEPSEESQLLYERDYQRDKLDFLRESFNLADELRQKYKLADNLTPQQVFDEVSNRNKMLSERLEKVEALKKLKEQSYEKVEKVKPQGESQELPQGSDEN